MDNSISAFLRRKAILARYGISNSTLYGWIAAGKFPAPIKLVPGGSASAWLKSEIESFDAARIEEAQRSTRAAEWVTDHA